VQNKGLHRTSDSSLAGETRRSIESDNQMKRWLLLALFPFLVYAEAPESINKRKAAIFIEVQQNQLVVDYDRQLISASDLTSAESNFSQFLDMVAELRDMCYIVLLLRPEGSHFQQQLRAMIRQRDIDIGVEPWAGEREINFESMRQYYLSVLPDGWWPGLVGTPIEVSPKGREVVNVVCLSNQLYTVAKDDILHESDINMFTSIDTNAFYVHFLVDSGGIDVFRSARKAAWTCGLDIICDMKE
jgi:hypothetical protein